MSEDMLLPAAEVQYVCRNAARQYYGQQVPRPSPPNLNFAPIGNIFASQQRLKISPQLTVL
jgi:hypothetical protein